MGYMNAVSMAETNISLEQAIQWHLRSNHYPPVPSEMIPVAVKAIERCRESNYKSTIKAPFEHRVHGWNVPAHVIVDSYHLEPWCE